MASIPPNAGLQFQPELTPKLPPQKKTNRAFMAITTGLVGAAAIALSAAYLQQKYQTEFSPFREGHDIATSHFRAFYNEYADGCASYGHKAQEIFFDIFEKKGSLHAFLEDRNKEAFMCSYYLKDITDREKNDLLVAALNRFEREDSLDFVQLLIRDGANPNLKYTDPNINNEFVQKQMPLLKSYKIMNEEFMEFLLENGARHDSYLRIKQDTPNPLFKNKELVDPKKRPHMSTHRYVTFFDYVIQDTKKMTEETQEFCDFSKNAIKLMLERHTLCSNQMESYPCKHFRYLLPRDLEKSTCKKLFEADTFFSQPDWSYTKDFQVATSEALASSFTSISNLAKRAPNMFSGAIKEVKNTIKSLQDNFWGSFEEMKNTFDSFYKRWCKTNKKKTHKKKSSRKKSSRNTNRRKEPPKEDKYPIPKDVYDARKVLGLGRLCSRKKLRAVCKKGYLQYHPDQVRKLPKGEQEIAVQKFMQIQQACEILQETF